MIHPSPEIVIDNAIKKAYFLPLVSEMRLTTMSPTKEPIGKQDWMNVLAHSKSQYNPIEVVMVKSTAMNITQTVTRLALVNVHTGISFLDNIVPPV